MVDHSPHSPSADERREQDDPAPRELGPRPLAGLLGGWEMSGLGA